jgi:hypothetical protein
MVTCRACRCKVAGKRESWDAVYVAPEEIMAEGILVSSLDRPLL